MSISGGTRWAFQKAIMEKGFFPEVLPPCFRVSNFYDMARQHNLLSRARNIRNDLHNMGESEGAIYNATKRGSHRRIFSCPNPVFFIRMAAFLGHHRVAIDNFFATNGKHYSCSIPQLDTTNPSRRSIEITSYNDFDKRKRKNLGTFPFLVKADTLRFYPSIYTHAIPWAFHGKEVSKQDRGAFSQRIFMNELDCIIRQSQRGQTIGIPIGPDVSRIISEIISVAVDAKFKEQMPSVKGVRLVDDTVFGAGSDVNAQGVLAAYRNSLQFFELNLNEEKTIVLPTKQDIEPYWSFSIKRDLQYFRDIGDSMDIMNLTDSHHKNNISNILDNSIRMSNELNDDGILKFMLRHIDRLELWREHFEEIESFLALVAVHFPHTLPYVARIVLWLRGRIDANRWKKICKQIIIKHAPHGDDQEVAWACWILKHFRGARLTKTILNSIISDCGPIPTLMAADIAETESQSIRNFARRRIMQRLSGGNLMFSSDWILAYEAERLFGYNIQAQNRAGGYFVMDYMIDAGVQFYDNAYHSNSCDDNVPDGQEDQQRRALDDIHSIYGD